MLALAAQFACDLVNSTVGEWLAHGVAPSIQFDALREVWLVDTLLAPIGLLAAFASATYDHAFLLVLPLAMLLAVFARERYGRIGNEIELSATYRGTALLLGDVISSDDELTGSHSPGVVALALDIADELRLKEEERRLVEFAAMLCDIGKMETPREILHKPGPLSAEEWEAMRTHTIAGQACSIASAGRCTRSGSSCGPRASALPAMATPTRWPVTRSRCRPASWRWRPRTAR